MSVEVEDFICYIRFTSDIIPQIMTRRSLGIRENRRGGVLDDRNHGGRKGKSRKA